MGGKLPQKKKPGRHKEASKVKGQSAFNAAPSAQKRDYALATETRKVHRHAVSTRSPQRTKFVHAKVQPLVSCGPLRIKQ